MSKFTWLQLYLGINLLWDYTHKCLPCCCYIAFLIIDGHSLLPFDKWVLDLQSVGTPWPSIDSSTVKSLLLFFLLLLLNIIIIIIILIIIIVINIIIKNIDWIYLIRSVFKVFITVLSISSFVFLCNFFLQYYILTCYV